MGSGVVIGGTGGGGVTVATSVSPVAAAAVVSTTTTETSKNPNDEIEIGKFYLRYFLLKSFNFFLFFKSL